MNCPTICLIALACSLGLSSAQVVISEIHYNPVEKGRFNDDGTPILDLSSDVHEFLKLQNAGSASVDLSGWKLTSGIEFTFPAGTSIPANGYLCLAKNPSRLTAVYAGLSGILGPYTGTLANNGETVTLENAAKEVIDSVTYNNRFPWTVSADALGAGEDWTKLEEAPYQYKGRSLQRVSAAWNGDDPANWLASPPIAEGKGGPNPGGANAVTRAAPKPVVVALHALQESNLSKIIRPDQAAKIICSFSPGDAPKNVQIEYWVDDINLYDEPRLTVAMTLQSNGQYVASLPAQAARKIVRYRVLGDRGEGLEVISPRADDPAVVPTSVTAREAWHAYFTTPERTQTGIPRPIYDCFVATANKTIIDRNANQSPKRVTNGTANGVPRALPFVPPTAPLWNATVPAVFVHEGEVYDIQIRHHGSRYNRGPGRNSFKVQFLDYQPFRGRTSNFVTDKQDIFITCHGLFRAANLPLSETRWVEWYFNAGAKLNRLEQGEYDEDQLDAYHEKMERITPGAKREASGEYYKSVGSITLPDGPYARGDEGILLAQAPTASFKGWTALEKYEWTYTLQNNSWKGALPIKQMIEGMWAARGNTDQKKPPESIPVLRKWFEENFDVETTLTSMALLNWMCPWDDTTQNHFVWRRANGKWSHLPWDFDAMYGAGDTAPATSSLYIGEVGDKNNNFRGPNFLKDSFIKSFRDEFTQRIWYITNTLCDPENLDTLSYVTNAGTAKTFRSQIGTFVNNRRTTVNTKAALGVFHKPQRPENKGPSVNASVIKGASLQTSEYVHSNTEAPKAHASTRWEIREADDSYDKPAHVEISTANKTALPIPFEKLKYGRTYFWRAIYSDSDNHPSVASAETSFSYGALSPTPSALAINEVLAENRASVPNGGAFPDFIELRNFSTEAVSLAGKSLTDNPLEPERFKFPAGLSIPAGGYLVIWCDAAKDAPGLHTGFALDRGGQTILLLEGGTVLDSVSFGAQTPDLSLSRSLGSEPGIWGPAAPTPGAVNQAQLALGSRNSLIINEWLAAPADGDDWIEIYNTSDSVIPLDGIYISDSYTKPKDTQFPPLSFIRPKGHIRVTANGSNDGYSQANFKLSSFGDSIVLTDTDGISVISAVNFAKQNLGVAQGRQPDGGSSIVNFLQGGTPGEPNPSSVAGDADGDGLPDAYETANGLNPANPADAAQDKDSDGQSNRDEFLAGTSPTDAADVFRARLGTDGKLGFRAKAGRAYSVEMSEDLAGNSWKKVSDLAAEAADRDVQVPVDRGANRRFYRAVTPPR